MQLVTLLSQTMSISTYLPTQWCQKCQWVMMTNTTTLPLQGPPQTSIISTQLTLQWHTTPTNLQHPGSKMHIPSFSGHLDCLELQSWTYPLQLMNCQVASSSYFLLAMKFYQTLSCQKCPNCTWVGIFTLPLHHSPKPWSFLYPHSQPVSP